VLGVGPNLGDSGILNSVFKLGIGVFIGQRGCRVNLPNKGR
jgi:hypothetical protein